MGKGYEYQDQQSYLLWYFFAQQFPLGKWKEGKGSPPLCLHKSIRHPILRNVNAKRSASLSRAFRKARQEEGVSEEEAGILVRVAQFE